MTRTVTTQAELDAALADDAVTRILIDAPRAVAIRIDTSNGKAIGVQGETTVEWVTGSATVERVDGSATVERVDGSATAERRADVAMTTDNADAAPRPYVMFDPAQNFGAPSVADKRIPVAAVAGMVYAGETTEVVADEYGITRHAVLVACWWMARYGPWRYRWRWRKWLMEAEDPLWQGRPDECPDPRAGRKP